MDDRAPPAPPVPGASSRLACCWRIRSTASRAACRSAVTRRGAELASAVLPRARVHDASSRRAESRRASRPAPPAHAGPSPSARAAPADLRPQASPTARATRSETPAACETPHHPPDRVTDAQAYDRPCAADWRAIVSLGRGESAARPRPAAPRHARIRRSRSNGRRAPPFRPQCLESVAASEREGTRAARV